MRKIKPYVLVIDDDEYFAENTAILIQESNPDINVTCCSSVKDAKSHLLTHEQPHLVFMDISMPDTSGVEGVIQLSRQYVKMPIIMVTIFDDSELLINAIKAGAVGYVLKENLPTCLPLLLEQKLVFCAKIAQKVIGLFKTYTHIPKLPEEWQSLTHQEKKIIELLAQGHKLKEIADILFISYETCRKHLQNIYGKIHINSQQELIDLYRGY